MHTSPTLRLATPADAEVITSHRHKMFRDNGFATEEVLARMDEAFLPWVYQRLADSKYLGLLLEEDNTVIAGAGIFFSDFPPHWRHVEPVRAYLLNVYTESAFRGRGMAKQLMHAVLKECAKRGITTAVLHASPQGRPMYEEMGFSQSDEMMISLSSESASV